MKKLELELRKRIMLELIEYKYTQSKSKIIRIDENDFRDQGHNNTCFNKNEILEILLSLELSSKGKIKLKSVAPKNDRPKNEARSEIDELFDRLDKKIKYPYYFFIFYDPFISEKLNHKKDVITLSRKKGLCRVINNTEVCYLPDSESDRYKILFVLEKDFVSPKLLANRIQIPYRSFMAQVGDIREQIENIIKIKGEEVIQTLKRKGYRINPSIKITS
jgi:hypothetical protein